MRILLVRLRQIGDVVFTTPATGALRARYPDATITYLVEPAAAPVLAGHPAIDQLLVVPPGMGETVAVAGRLRRVGFDLAIDFHGGPRASLLTWLSGAPTRIGYDVVGRSWMYTIRVARPRELRARHSVENQWDLLAPLGIPAPSPETDPVTMAPDPDAVRSVGARLAAAGVTAAHRLIVIHVSAGNPFRRWPATSFAALAVGLVAHDPNRRIIVTSGPSDRDAADQVRRTAVDRLDDASRGAVVGCGEFTLAELRALVARASLFIGGDSGPLHVAATSEVPIVGVYGPTLPARSAPWRSARWTTLAVDVPGLACRPCDQRVCTPGDFRCLGGIPPDLVIEAAERALAAPTRV